MTLAAAIERILDDLPSAVRDEIATAALDAGSACSGEKYSFRRNERIAELRQIVERRFYAAQALAPQRNRRLEQWLVDVMDILDQISETECVYQGHVVHDHTRYSFLVAPSIQKSVSYRSSI